MKIVDVKKFGRSIAIIFGIIAILSLFIMSSSLSYKELEYTSIYVSDGDTLWSISSELQLTSEYYKGKDIRDIIDHLAKINNLESKAIYVGQKLDIPTV